MGRTNSTASSSSMDTTEAWNEKDQAITVTEGNGFLYSLALRAKVDSAPQDIYHILTDPNTVSIFRSIKECTYRNVLEDDGKGRRKLEVGHRAQTRFLFFNICFDTHLCVWEDDNEKTIKFQLARPSMMQKFDGCWRIKPFTQQTLDSIYHPERLQPQQQQPHNGFGHSPFNVSGLFGFLHPHKEPEVKDSLVTLEQSILPRGSVPPGLKGLIRAMCAHQIRCMMEDLRKELQRRKDGTSTTLRPKALTAAAEAGEAAADKAKARGKAATTAPAASMALASQSLWRTRDPIQITFTL